MEMLNFHRHIENIAYIQICNGNPASSIMPTINEWFLRVMEINLK